MLNFAPVRIIGFYLFIFAIAGISCNQQDRSVAYSDSPVPLSVEESIDYLRTELEESPENSNTLLRIARSFSTYNIDSAIFYASEALRYSESPETIHYALAYYYAEKGDPQLAIAQGLAAEESGLVSSELKKLMARQYIQLEDWGKADLYLRQALELSEADESTLILRSRLYLFEGDTGQAIRNLADLRREEYAFDKFVLLGNIYDSQGKDSLALDEYLRALKYRPDDKPLLRDIAYTYRDLGVADSALAILSQLDPDYDNLMERARIYYDNLVWDSTLVLSARASAMDTAAVDPVFLQARVYAGRRDFERARFIYDSLIQADTTNYRAREELASMNSRIRYLLRQKQQQRQRDSLLFRPIPIRSLLDQ